MLPRKLFALIPTTAPTTHSVAATPSYQENTLWRCRNRHTQRVHIIHGPLANILTAYPDDYVLTYMGLEHSAPTAKAM